MLSSTVDDLLRDRATVVDTLTKTTIVHFEGISPITGPTYSGSAYVTTMDMAEGCHLYILLLGARYGYITHTGKSATELEFDRAYRDDPTKILVFRKQIAKVEKRQRDFIGRVGEYHKGYYIREYSKTSELQQITSLSFQQWLHERASVGVKLNYFDHFIRLAIQRTPFPGVSPSYVVAEDHLELRYQIMGKIYSVHFGKAQIYNDFWGSIVVLESRFEEWKESNYGRNP